MSIFSSIVAILSINANNAPTGYSNYYGEQDSIVGVVLVILTIGLLIAMVGYFGWSFYHRVIRFKDLCRIIKFPPPELGFLTASVQKFKLENPCAILERRAAFDNFSNQVAQSYPKDYSIEEFKQDSALLYSIRRILHFRHSFEGKVLSSRSLPECYPLSILYFDNLEQRYYAFESQVINRRELFLEIQGTISLTTMQIFKQPHPALEIWFVKDNKQYSFTTTCVFHSETNNIWSLLHSKKIIEINVIEDLKLTGVILYSSTEETEKVDEYLISIKSIDYKKVKFRLEKSNDQLTIGGFLSIDIHFKTTDLACQGSIENVEELDNQTYYTINFKDLTDSIEQFLISFTIDPQKFLTQ